MPSCEGGLGLYQSLSPEAQTLREHRRPGPPFKERAALCRPWWAWMGFMAVAVVLAVSGSPPHPNIIFRRLTGLNNNMGEEGAVVSSTHLNAAVPEHVARRTKSLASGGASTYTQEALKDEVTSLPALKEKINFRQFAGYLPITEDKKVFYWFVESEKNPEQAPLALWTNGGPGCSGLFGFLTENGPYRASKHADTLYLNPYRWNKLANMIFVEIPVGVGFSKSSRKADYNTNDNQTASDNYLLIQAFYDRYPHLRENDFYLLSESYGGHYLPMLAKKIVMNNQDSQQEYINLKGFAVGNPLTDPVENVVGMFDTLWGHQLVPQDLYEDWKDTCESVATLEALNSDACFTLETQMFELAGDVDPYALDYPVCHSTLDETASKEEKLALTAGRNQRYFLARHAVRSYHQEAWSKLHKGSGFEECEEVYASIYLNREDVKKAIHADASIKWVDCSTVVNYEAEDEDVFMQPYYRYLVETYKKLRILVYSGDNDSVCATRGTQYWIDELEWTALTGWSTWSVGGQVAGYMKQYDNNFTFATVHGAGHEVPTYKPAAALKLFEKFLNGDF